MVLVCYEKPNRTKVRNFTVRDIQRIAKNITDNGISPLEVIAAVAVALGIGSLVCKSAKLVSTALSIASYFADIGIALGLAKLVDWLIVFFGSKLYVLIPKWNVFAVVFILVLGFMTNVLKKIAYLFSAKDDAQGVSDTLIELCNKVKMYAALGGEKIEDVVTDDNVNLDEYFKALEKLKNAVNKTIGRNYGN